MVPAPNQNGEKNSSSNKNNKKGNKKQKLESKLDVNMDEHEGETLVTNIASSKKPNKSKAAASDETAFDTRRLEKLAKSNPAFYAMLQEDGVVAGGGPGFEEGFDEDEQFIRHYEKKLGIKRKDAGKLSAKKSFLDDGLGDLLEGIELGSRGRAGAASAKKIRADTSVTSKNLPARTDSKSSTNNKRKAVEVESESEDDEEESDEDVLDDSEGDSDMDSFDEELEGVDPEDMEDDDDTDDEEDMESFDEELEGVGSESDDDNVGFEDEEDLDDMDSDDDDDEEEEVEEEDDDDSEQDGEKAELKETTPNSTPAPQTGKYLPPHLRAAAAAAAW